MKNRSVAILMVKGQFKEPSPLNVTILSLNRHNFNRKFLRMLFLKFVKIAY